MSGLSSHLSPENRAELLRIVRKICQPGKGILAADETPMAMENRFEALKIPNTAEVSILFSSSINRGTCSLSRFCKLHFQNVC